MSESIANNNMQISVTPSGPWAPADPNDPAQVVLVKNPDPNVDAPAGIDVLVGEISWTIIPTSCALPAIPGTLPAHTHISGGSVTPVQATGTKTKCSGTLPLREGDQGACQGLFKLTASPFTDAPCACTFEITDAGQSKAKAE